MVKSKGKAVDAPLDSQKVGPVGKQDESLRDSSPDKTSNPAPSRETAATVAISTDDIATPYAKRLKLQEQLQRVDKQASYCSIYSFLHPEERPVRNFSGHVLCCRYLIWRLD